MSTTKPIIIAIDGFSSCGKSTLAKDLASRLSYKYVDSGAMYRAVTLYCLENDIDVNNEKEVNSILDEVTISFECINGTNHTFLNGRDVEERIRTMDVSNAVSEVARLPLVREKLVKIQHAMGLAKGITMDGRDITTVVFPQAELKVFVVADPDVRAQRRYDELISKGKKVNLEEVKANLIHRDKIDSQRSHSPLTQAPDAYVLDNSYLNRTEQVEVILNYMEHIQGNDSNESK